MGAAELTAALIDWFWAVGCSRQGRHALGTGTWLDRLYALRESASQVDIAKKAVNRCVALWGPSQAGKSTLLSAYLDQEPSNGLQSALQWHPDEPVVFVGRQNTPANCIQLNPFNQGADASGCASRFVLRNEVEDRQHPVEVDIASERHLLHALAAGFVSECDLRQNGQEELFFDQEKFQQLLEQFETADGVSRHEAYGRLQEVADVLEDLIDAQWDRYRNLGVCRAQARTAMLSHKGLLARPEAVDEFAARLFWNGQAKLTDLYQSLREERKRIARLAQGKVIRCSYRVAKLFLDISSYQDRLAGKLDDSDFQIRAAVAGNRVVLNLREGELLFNVDREFGLLQALVWEVRLPVRAETISQTAPAAHALLSKTDVLDFPGVALAQQGGARRTVDSLSEAELLTRVVKRGKTACIVPTYARNLMVDGVSLLLKIASPLAQPNQILHGLETWSRTFEDTPPFNLVLTFGAKFVNDELFRKRAHRDPANFEDVFVWLDKLGELSNPSRTRYFVTTYPWLPGGAIDPMASKEELEALWTEITKEAAFQTRFGGNLESIRAMLVGGGLGGDGGVGHFIQQLTTQAQHSRLPIILENRAKENAAELKAIIDEALPVDSSGQRRSDLAKWRHEIEQALISYRAKHPEDDAAQKIGYLLRRLLTVDASTLERLPLQARNSDVTGYLGRQFTSRWLQNVHTRRSEWGLGLIGLSDQALTERLLSYLCDFSLREGVLAKWLQTNFGELINPHEADLARRFLAIKMSDSLCFGNSRQKLHRNQANVHDRLAAYAGHEGRLGAERNDRESPHYVGFINPFLEHLDLVAKSTPTNRPAQPGDDKLELLRATLNG
jgi:hypothetical protein